MNFNWILLDAAANTASGDVQAGGAGGLLMPIIMFGVMFLAMYFFIIRPQKKKEKAEKQMRENLMRGVHFLQYRMDTAPLYSSREAQ